MRISKKIIWLAVAVIIIIAAAWTGLYVMDRLNGNSKYSAVYMATGDIYLGQFSRFPTPRITDAWYIQRGVDKNNQPQLGVVPMKSVFWSPAGTMYLNEKEIVFWVPIRSDSEMAKALANPQSMAQQNQGPAGTTTPPPTPAQQQEQQKSGTQ